MMVQSLLLLCKNGWQNLRNELVQQQRAHAEDQKLVHDLRLEHDRLKNLTESLSSSLERLHVENASLTQQVHQTTPTK